MASVDWFSPTGQVCTEMVSGNCRMAEVWTNLISPEAGSALPARAGCGAWWTNWQSAFRAGAARGQHTLVRAGLMQLRTCLPGRRDTGWARSAIPSSQNLPGPDRRGLRRRSRCALLRYRLSPPRPARSRRRGKPVQQGNRGPSSSACRCRWRGRASCTLRRWCRSVCRSRQAVRGRARACRA
jgi:hypothetical protein